MKEYEDRMMRADRKVRVVVEPRASTHGLTRTWRVRDGTTIRHLGRRYRPGELFDEEPTPELLERLQEIPDGS